VFRVSPHAGSVTDRPGQVGVIQQQSALVDQFIECGKGKHFLVDSKQVLKHVTMLAEHCSASRRRLKEPAIDAVHLSGVKVVEHATGLAKDSGLLLARNEGVSEEVGQWASVVPTRKVGTIELQRNASVM
jgi:hypothetical protein